MIIVAVWSFVNPSSSAGMPHSTAAHGVLQALQVGMSNYCVLINSRNTRLPRKMFYKSVNKLNWIELNWIE